jgi:hypothetical protein
MKSSVAAAAAAVSAVQYPQPLTVVVSDFARVSPRHGITAYVASIGLALLTLLGSSFFKEIRRTFGHQVLGVRALVWWEAAFCVLAIAWLASLVLGITCLSHKGRSRSLGAYSVAINIASALLVVCTATF